MQPTTPWTSASVFFPPQGNLEGGIYPSASSGSQQVSSVSSSVWAVWAAFSDEEKALTQKVITCSLTAEEFVLVQQGGVLEKIKALQQSRGIIPDGSEESTVRTHHLLESLLGTPQDTQTSQAPSQPEPQASTSSCTSNTASGSTVKQKKIFPCPYCSKALKSKESQKEHMRIHTGEKPFQCEVCLKTFSHRTGLNGHLLIHQEKSLQCRICGRSFRHRRSMSRHLNIHKT